MRIYFVIPSWMIKEIFSSPLYYRFMLSHPTRATGTMPHALPVAWLGHWRLNQFTHQVFVEGWVARSQAELKTISIKVWMYFMVGLMTI